MAKKGKKGGLGGLIASGSDIKKNIGPRAINGAIRIGGGFIGNMAGSKIKKMIKDKAVTATEKIAAEKKLKFVDMGTTIAGFALDIFSNNEMVRSFGQGMQVVGGISTVKSLMPAAAPGNANGGNNQSQQDQSQPPMKGLGSDLEDKIAAEWDAVVNNNNMNGMGDANATDGNASIVMS